jgi:small subunit ribosomal protein S4
MKLFLKGDRCYTDKCGYERRAYAPGQHGQARRRKLSNYGSQLREKQKVKRIYGLAERQFRGYYHKAIRMKGVAGEKPAAAPRAASRQRGLPARVRVRPRRGAPAGSPRALQGQRPAGRHSVVPLPLVRPDRGQGAVKKVTRILESLGAVDRRGVPKWLELDKDNFKGKLTALPARDDLTMPIREQLIVELYSR